MPGFFDRLGKAAQLRASEGKLRLNIVGSGRKLDERAQALGHLLFRQNQGETIAVEEFSSVLAEMRQVLGEKQAREAELEALLKPVAGAQPAAAPQAAPAPAPTPEAAAEVAPAPAALPVEPEAPKSSEA